MFTGIIQHLGQVESIEPVATGARLVVDGRDWGHRPSAGDSIAVNGCCLTVAPAPAPGVAPGIPERQPAGSKAGPLAFDVIRQTLDLTTLGELKPGDKVNLEHAVTPATLMGGHIVQGHVDAVGRVMYVLKNTDDWRVRIVPLAGARPGASPGAGPGVMHFIVPQGSIAVDGVSLTIAAVGPQLDWFEVALIPTTLRLTTLGSLAEGRRVNLETDCLAKMVITLLQRRV